MIGLANTFRILGRFHGRATELLKVTFCAKCHTPTDVSEERIVSIFRVEKIRQPGSKDQTSAYHLVALEYYGQKNIYKNDF
jgi:hypothetical protein